MIMMFAVFAVIMLPAYNMDLTDVLQNCVAVSTN